MNQRVAIVILNWNGLEDTLECLESLEKNSFRDYKIFLVDNGSNDGSAKKFKQIKDRKIEVIPNKNNLGFAAGNNLGIKKVLGQGFDYFMILNNDTIVDRKFLSELVRVMLSNDDVGVVSPIVFNYYDKNSLGCLDSPGRFNLKNGGGEPWSYDLEKIKFNKKPFFVDYTSASCWLVRSSIIKKTGGFNENFFAYGEEIDLGMRIQKAGYKFLINPASKIWHKGAASSGKVSGFKVYYSTRNMIWLERIHANNKEFLIFLMNLFFVKTLKNIYISFLGYNKLTILKKYFEGMIHGLFVKSANFNDPKYYKI
jgi:hypothetical protein